ncbi:MAG: hypothetical protein RI922_33 [Bacteroidota bacterium]|jgi:lysyl-tRNA synthetase class I
MDDDNNKQRLSLLVELIKMAKADDEVREIEFDFLLILAQQMGVSKDDFKQLFEQYIAFHPPKLEGERILQFQRLILIMNVDSDMAQDELDFIRELGIKMGLHPNATNEVLTIMNNYDNKVVPPEKLIEIFKTFHN